MEEPNVSPAPNPVPNADARLAELERQYAASSQEGKRLAAENQQLKAVLSQVEQQSSIPVRGQAPLERLREWGLPAQDLDEYVQDKINEGVKAAFEPIAKMGEARNRMLSQYGNDFQKFESDVAAFIQEDPAFNAAYNKMWQADPAGAIEYAFLKFGESRRRTQPQQSNGVSQQQAAAQIPTSRSGDSRGTGMQQSDLQEAWEHYQRTGDPNAYAKARLRTVIRDEHLNG